MNAFDADCLIYAAAPDHPHGAAVRGVIAEQGGVGSVMLLPELLTKPIRSGRSDERERLAQLLANIELVEVTQTIAEHAVALGVKYGLRSVDSIHLATATYVGADRFVTNNKRDFPQSITEIDVVYAAAL